MLQRLFRKYKQKKADLKGIRKKFDENVSDKFLQYVPHCQNVAHRPRQNKEMEDGVHVLALVEGVEQGAGDVADAFGNNPTDDRGADRINQGLEGDKYDQSHQHVADGFEVVVLLQTAETHDRAHNGAEPDEDEERPAPVARLVQGDEGDGRVTARNVPVDGGVVPLAQAFFPTALSRAGVIDGGGDVGAQHAEQIEPHAPLHPQVFVTVTVDQEADADNDAQQNASGMREIIGTFFAFSVFDCHILFTYFHETIQTRKAVS